MGMRTGLEGLSSAHNNPYTSYNPYNTYSSGTDGYSPQLSSSSPSPSGHSPTSSTATTTTAVTSLSSNQGLIQGSGGAGSAPGISVVLLHKPRGSKGVWYPIAQGDHIRVTKGKGKRLKLEVKSSVDLSQDVNVFLVLDGGAQVMGSGGDSGLIVESIRNLPPSPSGTSTPSGTATPLSVTELSLKLSRLSRRLSILVRAKAREGNSSYILEARSIEFSAHNNGKERYLAFLFMDSQRCGFNAF